MSEPLPDLAPVVAANNKLIKALIGLLAIKDPHLLEDMRTVFAMADPDDGAGLDTMESRTWARVRDDLAIIADMIDIADDEVDEQRPRRAADGH